MKFVANRAIIQGDSVEFMNIDEAKNSPLAKKLFHYPFVREVFIAKNFVSLTKYDAMEWVDVVMDVRVFIREYLAEGGVGVLELEEAQEKVTTNESIETVAPINQLELGEVEMRIVDILDEFVKPAVESDGGNIRFMSYEEGVVSVYFRVHVVAAHHLL